jgi:hypothetical protein
MGKTVRHIDERGQLHLLVGRGRGIHQNADPEIAYKRRTRGGLHGIDWSLHRRFYPELLEPNPKDGEVVALPILGGIHRDYRLVA